MLGACAGMLEDQPGGQCGGQCTLASAAGAGVTWQDLEHRGLRACGEDFGFDLNRLKALSRGGM